MRPLCCGKGERGIDGGTIAFQACGEGVQEGQVGIAGAGDPPVEGGGVARGRAEQSGEAADLGGQGGHLGAGAGDLVAQGELVLAQPVGAAGEEAGDTAWRQASVVDLERPWLM
ncbi:hypothetical protein ACIBCU_03855 [Streptomyces sp. NPDC051064]|uniref:hypothetical protein n=1 Tax=Streptomyces sp. NPDC051064 TaxID=3365641 RepID=UPI00379EE5F6